jgi:low affinity Fe/Cu permease
MKSAIPPGPTERFTTWIGSTESLVVHTIFFIAAFGVGFFHFATWELVLLVLTTVVSLEAIYLAIFIQITVNRNTESLREVEEDIDEIQEDVEDIGEDIEGLEKDVDEIQEDIEDLSEEEKIEEAKQSSKEVTIEAVTAHLEQLLKDLETLKKRR